MFDDRSEDARPGTGGRYYLIQCLRFFAASFVVAYHSVVYVSTHGGALSPDFAYYFGELSQIGILIFFSISGFVITHAIQRRSSADFLWLRALRIYPGFWLACVIAVLLQLAVFGTSAWAPRFVNALTQSPWSAVPGSLGGGGWTLIYVVLFCVLVAVLWFTRSLRVIAQYRAFRIASALAILIPLLVLGSSAGNARVIKTLTLLPWGVMPGPLGGVEWTLVYEVFFYLLIAMLWLTRSNRVVGGFCALWAITIAAAAVVWPSWGGGLNPTFARIGLSAYNFAFIAGVFAYFVHERLDLGVARTLTVLVPGLAVAGEFFARTEWKLACVAAAAFCLIAAVARFALARDAARDGLLTRWGDASYGLYLIHSTVIVVIFNSVIGVRQVHWAVAMVGLFGLGMGAGLLYGALEHRLYGVLKARIGRPPWRVAGTTVLSASVVR